MMSGIAFDTLRLAERLEAAGLPHQQARDVAAALADTIGATVVTRDYLDLKLEAIGQALGDFKTEVAHRLTLLTWAIGINAAATIAILGVLLRH
jgi:hypothetical protein